MANYKSEQEHQTFRNKVLLAAARLFLEKGYSNAGTRDIAKAAGVNVSTMNKNFGPKENILCDLVSYVFASQFKAADIFLNGKTDDPILYYAAETTLQLYMAESSEAVRNLYSVAYSMPHSSELIRKAVTENFVSKIFSASLPGLDIRDYSLRELASGGIIRSYMMVPCSDDFPVEKKVQAFLENALRIYQVPEEKIREAVEFVKQFDYPLLAQRTIDSVFAKLEEASI